MRMAAAAPHAHREVRTHRWRRGARDRTARLRVGMNYAWEAREVILGRCEDPGFRRGRGGGGGRRGGSVEAFVAAQWAHGPLAGAARALWRGC